jgi:hypothetical protein
MDASSLYAAVRAEVGKVANVIELADADILRESGYILTKIAERIPSKVLRYITSIINTREYDVYSATMRVQKVFLWDTMDENIMVLGGYRICVDEPNEYVQFPSLWVIEMTRKARALPRIRHYFDPVRRKLAIDPYPEEAGQKYWYISVEKTDWTLAKCPADFESTLVTGVVWKCLEIILLKRSNLGGILREGGFVDFPAVSMRPFIEAKKTEFFDDLEIKTKLYF